MRNLTANFNFLRTFCLYAVLEKAMAIQTNPALGGTEHRNERAELIRKLISQNFQTGEMARESLKDHQEHQPESHHKFFGITLFARIGPFTMTNLSFIFFKSCKSC
jgi:hypothetical protein